MLVQNIFVRRADITTLAVDAVVNSANRSLLGGGGVDRAIHRAAGRELLWACADLGGCDVGKSKITPGFRLPAKFVVHTVAPAWTGGRRGEAELLASAYRSALDLALERDLHSIAFSMLSRGIHRYPAEAAAEIAWNAILSHPFEVSRSSFPTPTRTSGFSPRFGRVWPHRPFRRFGAPASRSA